MLLCKSVVEVFALARDVRRRMCAVRADHAKNGEARRVQMNQSLTDILKSVKLANYQGERAFCS
jgi:hypothetical protein